MDRTGRRLTLVGAGLGLLLPAGFAVVIYVGTVPPLRSLDLGYVSFALVWAAPALLALLSLRSRPVLLISAAVVGFLSAFTSFSGVTFVLLVPAALYLWAHRRRGDPGSTPRAALAVLLPLLAWGGAFAVLLGHSGSACWSYSESADGDRTYVLEPAEDQGGDSGSGSGMGGTMGGTMGSGESGSGCTSATVTGGEAAASAALLAAGLFGAWTLARQQPPPKVTA